MSYDYNLLPYKSLSYTLHTNEQVLHAVISRQLYLQMHPHMKCSTHATTQYIKNSVQSDTFRM